VANLGDSMSIVNAITGVTLATTPVGNNPYTVVVSADGKTAYVSNLGGHSVSVRDALIGATKAEITVGTHPTRWRSTPPPGACTLPTATATTCP
jgi:YVTN family beta-propeller protein